MDNLPVISAQNISLEMGARQILNDVSIALDRGEILGLVGPNGSGKTSLMRAIMRFNTLAEGECNLWNLSPKARAKNVAWLAQERHLAWDLRVDEVVALGRTAWRDWRHKSPDDGDHVAQAIAQLHLENFRSRRFRNLSGGERARVLLARVIAQNTPFILADEPIDALDPAQQIHVMSMFAALAKSGKGVLLSIHDLSLAARYCSRLVLLDRGQIISEGDAQTVLSDANLEKVFGIKVYRADAQGPIIQPIQISEPTHEQS